MKTYSVKEAAEIVGIKSRAIQHRCKRDDIRKKDNKYLITDSLISKWIEKEKEALNLRINLRNAKANAKANLKKHIAQLDLENETLDLENESLKERIKVLECVIDLEADLEHSDIEEIELDVTTIQSFNLEEIEDFDFDFNDVKGNLVFVPKDKVYAEYTNEEYTNAEQKLNEWHTLQTRLEHKTELFEAEKLSSGELITHYKQQLKYQKEQSTRILDIHERLVQTVNSQNKQALQRNTIEAIDKGVVNKDTWKREG